ncbi:MAG: hypothetical protein LUD50_08260 [Clostridia bacterium]|nr:hypothetical protein [Clostridia bacterium]
MKFKFKLSYGTIAILAAIVLTILALVFSSISNTTGLEASSTYGVNQISTVIACGVVALVLAAVSFVLDCMLGNKIFSIVADVLRFAAAALLIYCFTIMISARAELMGYIWFSDFESGNATAISALNMAVVSWVFYFLGVVACAVSLFRSFCRKN